MTAIQTHKVLTQVTSPRSIVLFDLGETLFEPLPRVFGRRNLLKFARKAGVTDPDQTVIDTFAKAKIEIARQFVTRAFYRHREFIEMSFTASCNKLGKDGYLEANAYANAQRDDVIHHLSPRKDCFSTLAKLHERGHPLGIVSNIDDDWLAPLIERWKLSEHVNTILSSETAKSCKPDQRIFKLACEHLDCSPSQVLFVGDDEINDVHGSKRAGMTSVLFRETCADATTTVADCAIHRLSDLLTLPSLA